MLKYKMDSVDDVSDDIKALYTKSEDGLFYLTGVSGATSKEKVDTFRENNISLTEKLKLFDSVDVEKYKKLILKEEELQGKKTITVKDLEAKVTEGVETRVKDMRKEFDTEKAVLNKKNITLSHQLDSLLINNEVRAAASKHGILDTATDDVISRANSIYQVEDGKVVGYNGKDKLYDKTGENLLGIDAWVEQLIKIAPHLFKNSQGTTLMDGTRSQIDRGKMSSLQKIIF